MPMPNWLRWVLGILLVVLLGIPIAVHLVKVVLDFWLHFG
jgi:hypothetical protein